MALTHEQVNTLEQTLIDAQNKVEEAARMICGERDEGTKIWNQLNTISGDIAYAIHHCYLLRPYPDLEEI